MKKIYQKWLPPLLMFVMALWFFGNIQAPKDKDFAYSEFGQLPVTANGRIEPMDSLARNSLLEIREKQTLNAEPWKDWNQSPKMISATEWLANVMMNPAVADDWPVFRVDNPDLISLLKLPDRDPAKQSDGKHYSWNQIQPMLETFSKENERVQKVEAATRTAYENAIAKMEERLMLYASLRNTVEPAGAQNWPEELAAYGTFIPDGIAAVQAQQAGQPYDQTNFNAFAAYIQEFQFMSAVQPPLVLPPSGSSTQWRRMGDALLDLPRSKTPALDDAMRDYVRMTGALAGNQPDEFNAAVRDLHSFILSGQPKA
ncbi:MAG TPA: cytochrome C biogenesis protein, partial [Verrucomicrobiae bacterium]|nr:cytochrome C biogenesis protein [Verrucomicrobiae bacterium]